VQVIGQTLSAAHTATADLLKTAGKSLSATHSGNAVLSTVASHFRTLGATSVKTASLATSKIGNALLSATHTATAALTTLQVLGVTLSASATHTASLLEQKISSVVLSATHTATSTFQKLIGFILGATHTGSASLSAQSLVATPQLMSASATHGATLDKKVIKLVSASHTGLPTMRKGVSPSPLSASHTGTASLDTANLMTVTLPALHSMTPAMQTVFMEALVVASTIRKPVNKDIELPSFQSWHGAYRPSFDQLIAIGYAAGASALSYGSTVTGLNTTDGRVAFNESFLGYPAELSGSTVYVVSSSPSDTGDIRVQGLNDSGIYQDRTVALTGTTPVAVTGLWNHVQRMTLVDTTNVGTVYCSTNSGGLPTTLAHQIQCVMPVGANYAINPLLVAGENQLILINRFDFSTANRDSMKVLIEANRQGNWIQNFVFYTSDSQFAQDFKTPIALQPGAKLRCWVEMTGGSNGDASFGMNGFVMTDTIEKRAFKDQAGVDHFFT